ncbi:hypothetical protein J4430_03115 [Candidatus Woesearchaeota archaeon]|nr:hypothetical protein [Candidatus Woesearchaeota archaeon]
MKKSSSEAMHVGIENPKTYRKEVLTSAIDTIQILKRYETLRTLRKEKADQTLTLRKHIKELRDMFGEFHNLPNVHIETEHPHQHSSKNKKTVHPKEPHNPYLDKLQRDISTLRSKLNSL